MVILIAVGAGVGAVARYALTTWGKVWWPGQPLATVVINVTGALLAGVITGLMLPAAWAVVLLTGFCGGYTTFSTMMVDAMILLRKRDWWGWLWYFFGSSVLGIVAVIIGMTVGMGMH